MADEQSHPPGELIEDREVSKIDDDRLGHHDVVSQLVELVLSVPTPSNIALYGAWGSGKSGIGRSLATQLQGHRGVKFARFDSFKYAQNPLRRNFVSVVAAALNQTDSKYHEDLYQDRVESDFRVPFAKVMRLLVIFALVASVATAVVIVVAAISAYLQDTNVRQAIVQVFATAVPASLVPATLLTALIALIGKTFVQEKRIERVDSDEEFESLFQDLVNASGAQRLVVFVDEIDRCSPADVVETLNTVRTFLGVERCIFIVAADPQVVEQALSDNVSQATPADALNPYYSAGSSYLDKVFQYQVTIPPLMPQSVTSFAVDLVKDRPGIWQRIDASVVASILIPTHVRSPRRVKNLLNSFALAYRLAEARHESGLLDVDVANEIDELARIVCLRVEFPLFARDMVADPHLSEYVLRLAEASSEQDSEAVWHDYPYVIQQTRNIAEGYAGRQRQVDRLLIDDDRLDTDSSAVDSVTETHAQQLLDYLSRTRLVAGPTKALIHLQNSSSLFGLPSSTAEQIERDAQNGALSGIRTLYGSLSEPERTAAIQLLTQQCRSAVGYESRNIGRALLAAIGTHGLSDEAPDACVLVVGQLLSRYPDFLDRETVIGAWQLALASERAEARALGKTVLRSELTITDDAVFVSVVQSSVAAERFDKQRFGDVVLSRLLTDDPSVSTQAIAALPETELDVVLRAVEKGLPEALSSALTARNEWVAAQEEVTSTSAKTSRSVAEADEEVDDSTPPLDPKELLEELTELAQLVNKHAAERVASVLLGVNSRQCRDHVENLAEHLTPIDSPTLAKEMLEAASMRTLKLWPTWLAAVPSEQLLSPAGITAVIALAKKLQSSAQKGNTDADVVAASESFEPLMLALDNSAISTLASIFANLGTPVEREDDLDPHAERVRIALLFASAGLCQDTDVLSNEADSLVMTLSAEIDEQEVDSSLAQYIIDGIKHVSGVVTEGSATEKLLQSISSCTWITEFDRAYALSVAKALLGSSAVPIDVDLPKAATVESYRDDTSVEHYDDLVAHWLRCTNETFEDIHGLIDSYVSAGDVPDRLLDALSHWRSRASELDRRELLETYLADPDTPDVADHILFAIGLKDLEDQYVANILAARYKSSITNPKRLKVLHLWKIAQIVTPAARLTLVREVLIPIFGQGVTAVGPALSYLEELAAPVPRGTKKALGDAVISGTRGRAKLEGQATKVLKHIGYSVKRSGLLGTKQKIDSTS